MTAVDLFPACLLNPATLKAAPGIAEHPEHSHTLDDIIGYVVRVTIKDGKILPGQNEVPAGKPARAGYDRAIFAGGGLYAEALDYRRALVGPASMAVIDRVYSCGCRS